MSDAKRRRKRQPFTPEEVEPEEIRYRCGSCGRSFTGAEVAEWDYPARLQWELWGLCDECSERPGL